MIWERIHHFGALDAYSFVSLRFRILSKRTLNACLTHRVQIRYFIIKDFGLKDNIYFGLWHLIPIPECEVAGPSG